MAFMDNLLLSLGNMGQGIDSAMTGAANPFGLAPPPGMSAEQAGRMPYLDLGMGMLANSTKRPLEAAAGSFKDMRQQGMDMGTKRLWAQQVQSQLQDSKEERENKKKLSAALQGIFTQGGMPGMPTAGPPAAPMMPQAGNQPGLPQLAQQAYDPTAAQPVPQPMQQQGGGTGQFTPQQLFQAKYWAAAGNPEKAMEVLFKPANPTNWQTVTTDEGVFAFNPETRKMEKIGERPQRNEGPGRGFEQTDKLRDDYTKAAEPYEKKRIAYQNIVAAYEGAVGSPDNPGPADIAMVFSFMKMLDPGSTVMQGEYANAQNAGGVPERIVAQYNNLMKGDKLAPEIREAFLDQATAQYQSQLGSYGNTRKTFQDLATRNQLDPEQVAPDYTYGVTPYQRKSKAPDAGGWTTLPNGVRIRQKN